MTAFLIKSYRLQPLGQCKEYRAAEKKQESYYSGKKKRHTLKSQVVVNGASRRVICTAHGRGPTHDFALYKQGKIEVHESLELLADGGYRGSRSCMQRAGRRTRSRARVN